MNLPTALGRDAAVLFVFLGCIAARCRRQTLADVCRRSLDQLLLVRHALHCRGAIGVRDTIDIRLKSFCTSFLKKS